MKDAELFRYLEHKNDYVTLPGNFQYKVEVNDADRRIYCFFEETQQKSDWLTNISAIPKHWAYGLWWVHGGYRKVWNRHKFTVLGDVKKAVTEHKDYEVCFCGWSYGGAIALLSAVRWYEEGNKPPLLITFGAPKVALGNTTAKYFRHCLAASSRQNILRRDPGPIFPLLRPWRHVVPEKTGGHGFPSRKFHGMYGDE